MRAPRSAVRAAAAPRLAALAPLVAALWLAFGLATLAGLLARS